MKHEEHRSRQDLEDALRMQSLALDVDLSEGAVQLLVDHLEWLLKANETHNLTAVRDAADAVRLHVVDSLAAVYEVKSAVPGTLVDIGTGGGFPGVPLAVACNRTAVLLDSVAKKARALDDFLAQRIPSCHAVAVRAEDYAVEHPQSASVVVARAVAPLASLVELASPILKSGGRLVALKGDLSEQELDDAERTARAAGMSSLGVRKYLLPLAGERRAIICYERTGVPRVPLPRRVGAAQKRPIV